MANDIFHVKRVKSNELITQVEANEYVKKNKLPENVEYVVRNNIRTYREKLGLTQKNLADMLNITRQSVSLIETEQQTPSIVMCWLISKVLNAGIQELFYFEEIEKYEE